MTDDLSVGQHEYRVTHVLPDWKWYVLELVSEMRVDGDSRIVGHIETYLIHADSPDGAKALEYVDGTEDAYRNSDGAVVRSRSIGIHELDNLQTTTLQDGTLLASRLLTGNSHDDLRSMVRTKSELSLFGDTPYDGPNISQ